MKVITDRVAGLKKFPLSRLLEELGRNFKLLGKDMVRIARIGGPGPGIWALESILDGGGTVLISYDDLMSLASSDQDFLDELLCIHDRVVFGISDSMFMFVQSHDKHAEQIATSGFHEVMERPDRNFEFGRPGTRDGEAESPVIIPRVGRGTAPGDSG